MPSWFCHFVSPSDKLAEFRLGVMVVVVFEAVPDVFDLMSVRGTGAPHGNMTIQVHPQNQQNKAADGKQDPQKDLCTLLL